MPQHSAPAERFLAPVAVLGLQALLLADVAVHHRELLELRSLREGVEWAIAAAAIIAYLRTVICDPGFLRVTTSGIGSQDRRPASALCLPFLACAGLCSYLCCCRPRGGNGSGATSPSVAAGGARELRDVKQARAAELQPIGRSVLDAISNEVDSDPGEETIDLADLERGAPIAPSPVTRGEENAKPAEASLGKIPGSPKPGRAHKRRDQQGGKAEVYWQDRYLGPEGEDRRTVMQSGQKLRFCKACSMHQPLRTKHCRDCGRCVRTHDHHCPWVGTCVGEGNRVYFWWFLVAQWTELAVFLLESVLELLEDGFRPPLWAAKAPLLILGILVMGLLLLMVTCLVSFHTYLALTNQTTWENMSWHNISYLRSLPPEDGSPFSVSCRANLAVYCCVPVCPSHGHCLGVSAPVKLTEDGWVNWDLGEQHSPLNIECCGRNVCECFDVE